jgi:hypothetical protein
MKNMILLFCVLISIDAFAQTASQLSMALPLTTMGPVTQAFGESTNV